MKYTDMQHTTHNGRRGDYRGRERRDQEARGGKESTPIWKGGR